MTYINRAGLEIDEAFLAFVEGELAHKVGRNSSQIWGYLAELLSEFTPKIENALAKREEIQEKIDRWFDQKGGKFDQDDYVSFLKEINYIEPEPEPFAVITRNVDAEISLLAGPQLVVPVSNARFAINAANARWVSLYDTLYGTNVLGDLPKSRAFDLERAGRVRDFVRDHLDNVIPLQKGSWHDVGALKIENANLNYPLKNIGQLKGYIGDPSNPSELVLRVHEMEVRIVINPEAPVAKDDAANIGDVIVESAMSVIMDCEDSVAAVDGEDKAQVYRNWLGLMTGDISEDIKKGDKAIKRTLNPDIPFTERNGKPNFLKGRACFWVRNVGHLMTTPAVLKDGKEVPEGILDALFTVLASTANIDRVGFMANSQYGSIYIVKPKMHGPAEVALSCEIFARIEMMLHLTQDTIKIGIMDEERRTSVNLRACLKEAKTRVAFINTGFLDRTGDEIHTHMKAGPVVPKGRMAQESWLPAYEKHNVFVGLTSGLLGRAQIGKGMWAQPDDMKGLWEKKAAQLEAGASTAWVPSPSAAAVHAMHYHLVDARAVQASILANAPKDTNKALLVPPMLGAQTLSAEEIADELRNNLQGILGYVVRWVDAGIGCSKVPDIHDVELMEDRATCRISAQMVANWLEHGLVGTQEVDAALREMAEIVDRQNADDPSYTPMAPSFDGVAFNAARELVIEGAAAPSGYTEPSLHKARILRKQQS